jgi:signal transduction histidine kinase
MPREEIAMRIFFLKKWPLTVRLGVALIFTGLLPLAIYFVQFRQAVHRQLAVGQQEMQEYAAKLASKLDRALKDMERSARDFATTVDRLFAASDASPVSLEELRGLGYEWRMFTEPDKGNGHLHAKVFLTRVGPDQTALPELSLASNVYANAWNYLNKEDQWQLDRSLENGELMGNIIEQIVTALQAPNLQRKEELERVYRDIRATHSADEFMKSVKVQLHHTGVEIGLLRTSWLYITTTDGLMRIFPYHRNDGQPWDWKPQEMPYVTIPQASRQPAWTPAYWDTAGDGFMVTYSYPIIRVSDTPLRVVSFDVTLAEIEQFLRAGLSTGFERDANLFLVDGKGGILLFEGHRYFHNQPWNYHPAHPDANARDVLHWLNSNKPWLHEHVADVVHSRDKQSHGLKGNIVDDAGQRWTLAWQAIDQTGWRLAVLQTNKRVAALSSFWQSTVIAAIIAGTSIALVGVLLAGVMTRDLRRLDSVLRSSNRRSGGYVEEIRRVAGESSPEIARVAGSIAHHAHAVHFLIFKVRHEIKNPLTHLRAAQRLKEHVNDLVERLRQCQLGSLQFAEMDDQLAKINRMFDRIIFGTERISDCVELLRDEPEANLQIEVCRVDECVKAAAWIADTEYLGLDRIIKIDCDADQTILCFRVRLIRALINLLTNCGEAIKQKYGNVSDGTILVSARRDVGGVCIEIQDDGVGIRYEDCARLFQQGYSTADDPTERGYGLSVVQDIIEGLHGGSMTIESEHGRGTKVTIRIPHAVTPVKPRVATEGALP